MRTGPATIAPRALVASTLALALAAALGAAKHPGDTLESARGIAARLGSAGRAEAQVERRALDAFTGTWRSIRGKLTLEPPDRALLEFPATGERLALRGDGGEWLQPKLGQMLRLGPENAAAARRWWAVLLPGAGREFDERPLGGGRFAVVPKLSAGGGDTAWVGLDGRGLPVRLEYRDGGDGRIEFRLRAWKFARARGRAAFVIVPPESLQVVDLP